MSYNMGTKPFQMIDAMTLRVSRKALRAVCAPPPPPPPPLKDLGSPASRCDPLLFILLDLLMILLFVLHFLFPPLFGESPHPPPNTPEDSDAGVSL